MLNGIMENQAVSGIVHEQCRKHVEDGQYNMNRTCNGLQRADLSA